MTERFLPGVPGPGIEAIFDAAADNEIATGKFDSPESSGSPPMLSESETFRVARCRGCHGDAWPASSLTLKPRFGSRGAVGIIPFSIVS